VKAQPVQLYVEERVCQRRMGTRLGCYPWKKDMRSVGRPATVCVESRVSFLGIWRWMGVVVVWVSLVVAMGLLAFDTFCRTNPPKG
jgi:hypothetical protein